MEKAERELFEQSILDFESYLITLIMYATQTNVSYDAVSATRKLFIETLFNEDPVK